MKSIKSFFSAITFLAIISCSHNEPSNTSSDALTVAGKATVEFAVEGMVCSYGCAKGIEEKVALLEGVAKCNVDFEGKTATIDFDKSKITESEIEEIIEEMNEGQYEVEQMSIESEDEESADYSYNRESTSSFKFPELITFFMSKI